MSVDRAKRAFEHLAIEDRFRAIRSAKPYRSALESRGRSGVALQAAVRLEQRRWVDVERIENVREQPVGSKIENVFVAADTPEFAAWVGAGHKPGLNFARDAKGVKTGWWFPSRSPTATNEGCPR
jgi:hypothetical protein